METVTYRILSNEYLTEQKQIQEELPKLQARQQELPQSMAEEEPKQTQKQEKTQEIA